MRPRGTLPLILLATLALPAAGWQLVKQMEALLREGQERAQIDSAHAIARALVATGAPLPEGPRGLFVVDRATPPVLDGSGDDWPIERSRSSDGTLVVALAQDPLGLYVLAEIADASRDRADADQLAGPAGDRIEIALRDAIGLRRWRIGNAAPGAIQVAGGDPLPGEWAETATGYRLELRLPRPEGEAALILDAYDAGTDTLRSLELPGEPLPLLRADARLAQALRALAPEGARLRVASNEGWVLARAGALSEGDPAAQARVPAWQTALYALLLAPAPEAGADFAVDRLRLEAPVLWQALSGKRASSVRASTDANAVIVAAAVPILDAQQRTRGALLLEQRSEALLVLANRAVFGVLAAALLAVLLASLILIVHSGVLSLRIRRLRNAAERALTPDGRLEPKLPHLGARDDLGDLSRSFARLLGEIGAYTDYLRTLASKLSHELNTPLAIVRSSLDNLEHEPLSAAAQTYAQRARDGAERLSGILRSMAEASRMERAIASAEGEDFDLAQLARGCAEAYRDLVAPRRLEVEMPPAPAMFHGAPELIAQALDKLVDNARSFTPESGWIRIALVSGDAGHELAVANSGPPLPATMQERLFESLVSVRQVGAERREAPHLGLGLFIVRLVAELHGGEASARNLPDQTGVVFRLRLRGMPRRR